MSVSAASILYVLNKLKDKIKDGKVIKKVTFDNKPVNSHKIEKFDISVEKLVVEMTFTPDGGTATRLNALHYFRSDKPDEIQVNDDSVSDDDVDMDVDIHLLRADVEYKFSYTQSGRRHQLFMLASIDWF